MTARSAPLARIRLARSTWRLLAVPIALTAAGLGALMVAWLTGPPIGVALAVAAVTVVVGGVVGAALLLTVGVEVEEAAVRVRWLGGGRTYPLARGPVTRVTLRGPSASRLRPRLGALGWALGAARLRDDEPIDVVRLAPTRTAIVIPTERGRLAIAPAAEDELLAGLETAAQARRRLDELVQRAGPPLLPGPAAPPPPAVVRVMTGIERAELEARRASELAAARAAAEALRASQEAAEAARAQMVVVHPRRARPRFRIGRPAWVQRPGRTAASIVLPSAVALSAWQLMTLADAVPPAGSDEARLLMVSLLLAGPATSIGVIMARVWWPRLMGVVVAGGGASLVMVGRVMVEMLIPR
jgi:hypothetical protein